MAADDLRAIRVLDAWAKKHTGTVSLNYSQLDSRVLTIACTSSFTTCRRFVDTATPSEARIAAAAALVEEDPSLLEGL